MADNRSTVSDKSSFDASRRRERVLGFLLAGVAATCALSLGIASVDPAGFLGFAIAGPGRVLFSMLHLAAWWVPIYFLALTILVLRPEPLTWASVVLLNLVHVPVLTVGAILRLLVQSEGPAAAPLIAALERSFTLRGGALVLSLILAVESVVMVQIWRWLEQRALDGEDAPGDRAADEAAPGEQTETTSAGGAETLALPSPFLYERSRDEASTAAGETFRDEAASAEAHTAEATDRTGTPSADAVPGDDPNGASRRVESFQEMLAALRRRMEEGLTKDEAGEPGAPEDAVHGVPEPPLPLIFGRSRPDPGPEQTIDLEPEPGPDPETDPEQERQAVPAEVFGTDDEIIGEVVFDEEAWETEDDPEEDSDEDLELPTAAPVPPARRGRTRRAYRIPVDGILTTYSDGRYWEIDDSTRDAAEVLRVTLEEFGIRAEVTGIRKGPVITMFEILPAPGVKLAKITNLADNIALRLAASSVRIVAPIPGKHAVGIEIPNRERNLVSFAELLNNDEFFESDMAIPIALGKDIAGEAQLVDLARTPHLLIAGATGSGKSVCVNSIICSILYRRNPAEVKLILIDPKIVELKFYNDIPHLLTPVITDPKRAFQALQYLIYEMERRYSMLDSLGARDIEGYNAKIRRRKLATEPLPYIVVLIDEFADLMATSGKELESTVARLAAMSRAVGIHLVLATQRPSTDVITGLIKANIPSRIAFMVASKVDSRIIIDTQGAEKLLGRGDMLYTSAADPFPIRMQGAFLTEDEVEHVVTEVKTFGEPEYIDDEIFIDDDEDDLAADTLEDPLMEKAIEVVTTSRKASASYLQRRLKVGYNRAARMVEEMERMGIVGPQNGSKPREVMNSTSGV